MKRWIVVFLLSLLPAVTPAAEPVWQPARGLTQMPLWPDAPPSSPAPPGPEYVSTGSDLIGGKTVTAIHNVSIPTITVYPPSAPGNGTAVLVIPGGGFSILAMDLEGTEVCDWLVKRGVTCVLLKYRIPSAPYDWTCDCRPHNLALSVPSYQDTQRAMRLIRSHAAAWHVDAGKVGVLGFSAGGFLVAEASTNFRRRVYRPVDDVDTVRARPDFAVGIYPGHLTADRATLNPTVRVPKDAPPTFLLQAEDDHVDGVDQVLVYYRALKEAGVQAELHVYPHGGHAFGLRPTAEPITRWPALVDTWMESIGMLPSSGR